MAEAFSLNRLIKLMGMTTSSHDAEALVALRRANEEVARLNKSWQEILSGKITVIGDPFANMAAPPDNLRRSPPPASPAPQPTRQPPPAAAGPTTPPRTDYAAQAAASAYQARVDAQAKADQDRLRAESLRRYTEQMNARNVVWKAIPKVHKTYHIKEQLKVMGAMWDSKNRQWKVPEGDWTKVMDFVTKHPIPTTADDIVNLI